VIESNLVALPPEQQEKTDTRGNDVRNGTRALGDLRDASRNPVALARENNRKLAAWLRGIGLCAFAGQEAIFVQSFDLSLWLEYHAAAETDGGWTQAPYKGAHHNIGPTQPAAPDSPVIPDPAASACPAPVPPSMWTANSLPLGWGENEIGQPTYIIQCKGWGNGKIIDCTPVLRTPHCAYCTSVGLGLMGDGVTPRCGCPVRPDGHPDRVACENGMTGGGFVLVSTDGQACERYEDNPTMFWARDGKCKLCSRDGKVCGAAF